VTQLSQRDRDRYPAELIKSQILAKGKKALVIYGTQVFEHHFSTYTFFASTGIDIGHIITFLFIGFVVAVAARRNEMIATLTLALIYGAMAVVGSVYAVTRSGNDALLWRLTWYFADSFAIVIAGAIVRTHRLAAASRHSTS
jgi:hypothetical protein